MRGVRSVRILPPQFASLALDHGNAVDGFHENPRTMAVNSGEVEAEVRAPGGATLEDQFARFNAAVLASVKLLNHVVDRGLWEPADPVTAKLGPVKAGAIDRNENRFDVLELFMTTDDFNISNRCE